MEELSGRKSVMNRLIERGLLQEISCGNNFAYVLADAGLFQPTDYKVLHSQAESGFVRFTKMLFNGRIQLYYMPDNMKPLSAVLPTLNPETFLTVVTNLLQAVLETKNNGFLSCTNVDLSFDKIFVDTSNMKVRLVYLPVSEHLTGDDILFESQLRSELLRTIRTIPGLVGPKTTALAGYLMDGMLSMEDLCAKLKAPVAVGDGWKTPETIAAAVTQPEKPEIPETPEAPKTMRIVAMNAPKRVEYIVKKDHFLIGKPGAKVHAEIDFNRMISRVHCCVDREGDQFAVTDLGSTNGTFVNGDKLQPNQPKKVKDGDMLRLANSIFQVVIR
jgi:hypothetical protein